MNIPEFCADSSMKDLLEHWNNSKDLQDDIINRLSDPDVISQLTEAIQDEDFDSIHPLCIETAVCFLANALNIEVIEKEMFRRKMEDDNETD